MKRKAVARVRPNDATRGWTSRAAVLRPFVIPVLFLCIFARVLPLPRYVPDIPLDSSYVAALKYFRPHGFQFGTDAVYTFGPLGYLITFQFSGDSEPAQIVGAYALALLLAAVFTAAISRSTLLRGGLLFVGVLLSGQGDATYMAAPAAAWLAIATARRQRPAFLILAGVAMALLALIKFSFFLMAVCAAPAIVVLLWRRGNRAQAGVFSAALLSAYGALWLTFGGGWKALGLYLRGSVEVAAGYGQTMFLSPDPMQLRYGVVCAVLCGWIAATVLLYERDRARRLGVLVWMAGLALVWKHSFVRADESHLLSFFLFLPFAIAGLLDGGVTWLARSRQAAAAGVLVLAALSIGRGNPAVIRGMRPDVLAQSIVENFSSAWRVRGRIADLRTRLAAQKRVYDLGELKATIGFEPVDVFGQGQSLAILNDLRYRPRPAFQSFESYTPYLMRRNYAHYVEDAPPFVLFGYSTVDDRYPAQDDSLVLASILTNYELIGGSKFGHLLLRKSAGRSGAVEMRFLEERAAAPGEIIAIPGKSGETIWCVVHLQTTIASALRGLFFQPYDAQLQIVDGSGRPFRYRFLRAPGEVGFIVNPLLGGLSAVGEFLCDVGVAHTRSISLLPADGVTGALVKFYSIPPAARAAPTAACASAVFPGLGVSPRAIEGYYERVESEGKPRLLARAPATLKLDVPAGATGLRGEYGLMPRAYEHGGSTDGVVFRVRGKAGTAARPLWESALQPLTNATDRGIHSFRVAIPPGAQMLVLETDPGPWGLTDYDWSVWSALAFEFGGGH